jgi:DNA-binding NarL/FixJ family response regulator
VLSGLVRGDDVYELMAAVAAGYVPGRFTPDVALLELAVSALDLACPSGAELPVGTARSGDGRASTSALRRRPVVGGDCPEFS